MAKSPLLFPWPNLAFANMVFQSTMLAIEAQQVIAMRLTQMALGAPHVRREAELMVTEKLAAMAESGQQMMMAAAGGERDLGAKKVVKLYRRKVRANRRRLRA